MHSYLEVSDLVKVKVGQRNKQRLDHKLPPSFKMPPVASDRQLKASQSLKQQRLLINLEVSSFRFGSIAQRHQGTGFECLTFLCLLLHYCNLAAIATSIIRVPWKKCPIRAKSGSKPTLFNLSFILKREDIYISFQQFLLFFHNCQIQKIKCKIIKY